jgi:hypothetical protein
MSDIQYVWHGIDPTTMPATFAQTPGCLNRVQARKPEQPDIWIFSVRLGQCTKHLTTRQDAMQQIERFLIGALAAGVWTLVAMQVTSNSEAHAQEASVIEEVQENGRTQDVITLIHASEIVGLSALIEKIVRDRQPRPQSMPGLEQFVKSVVRRCRISGAVTGDRISSANISC